MDSTLHKQSVDGFNGIRIISIEDLVEEAESSEDGRDLVRRWREARNKLSRAREMLEGAVELRDFRFRQFEIDERLDMMSRCK